MTQALYAHRNNKGKMKKKKKKEEQGSQPHLVPHCRLLIPCQLSWGRRIL
jgi:hypothetical protein